VLRSAHAGLLQSLHFAPNGASHGAAMMRRPISEGLDFGAAS